MLLGHERAYLDAILFCPHHPDSGVAGERPDLKIGCDCRKPAPGLVHRAAATRAGAQRRRLRKWHWKR
jgi:histidinol phosphatase-like enzyme